MHKIPEGKLSNGPFCEQCSKTAAKGKYRFVSVEQSHLTSAILKYIPDKRLDGKGREYDKSDGFEISGGS